MKQLSEKQNSLLSRKEYEFEMEFLTQVPTKEEAKKEICKAIKAEDKLCVVKGVYTGFGSKYAKVIVYAYDNEEAMKRIEGYTMHRKILEKMKPAEAKA